MSTSELACTYASLILHDDGVEVTADNIKAILAAANVDVESYWPMMFAKLLEKVPLDSLITNIGAAGPPAAGGAASGAAAGGAAPAEEKKEEKVEEEESEEDMGFSLFD